MIKYLTILSCFLTFASGSLRAQALSGKDLRAYRLRQVEDAYREKMHLPEQGGSGVNIPGTKNSEMESTLATNDSNEKISTGTPESEVHAAINPTDTANIVIGPMNISPSTGLAFPIYYTTNFGKTWSKSSFHPLPYQSETLTGGGDPVFAYDANGMLYMTWIDTWGGIADSSGSWYVDSSYAGMYWASSSDGGKTWQRAPNGYIGSGLMRETINIQTGALIVDTTNGFDDKEWIAVDRSNSPHRNTLYVAWTHLGTSKYGVMVRRKLPGVDSMEPPVQVSSDKFLSVQYTSLGIDNKGGLHVTFMGSLDTVNYAIYEAYSSDGGASFQPVVKISDADIPDQSADARVNGDTIFGIRRNGNYPCANLSIDTAGTGNLYEVWCALGVEADNGIGSQIYFSKSTDNGTTWSQPSIVNNDLDTESNTPDHFYPSIAVNGKGTVSVTWYDRREDPNNEIGRYYIAQSTNQGKTWTNAPVAAKPMDFNYVMKVNQNFGIGEYTQVLTTSNYTIPVWTDGRDDGGNLRVYAAFLTDAPAGVERLSTVTEGLELSDNYPNPFSSTTNLSFTLSTSAQTRLYVTNIAGQSIAGIFDGAAEAGEHDFVFDGGHLSNGVYYLNLESDLGIVRRAITILR